MESQDADFEVVRHEETAPSAFDGYGGMLTPEIVAKAEAAVAMVKKVKALALGVTNHADWERFGDKAYLNESGSKKLGTIFGVSISSAGPTVETNARDEAGKPVRTYISQVKASVKGPGGELREVTEEGCADSKDDFFRYRWRDGKREELPFDELDFCSIRKKARTNALGRAMKSLLGYGNVLWEEVVGNVSKADQVTQVQFKGTAPKTAQTVSSADSASLKDKLWKMLLDLASGDETRAAGLLTQYSSFDKDGKHFEYKGAILSMKDGWAGATYKKVKAAWEASGLGGPPEPGSDG